jgi:predicted component of type VI protein secretion system
MDNLRSSPTHVEMHQFVRIIQQGSITGKAPSFRAANSLAFPASDITQYDDNDERRQIELSCLGLNGVSSPLPHYFITDALDEDNASLREFLRIFNQLIYRAYFYAWKNKHPHLFLDSALRAHNIIIALCADNLDSNTLVPGIAELLMHSHRSFHAFQYLLDALYPEIPRRVTFNTCEWLDVHEPVRLGLSKACLGDNITLGKRVAAYAHRIKIELGPLRTDQLNTLHQSNWMLRFLKHALKIDLELKIDHKDARSTLGKGMCLGFVSVLNTRAIDMIKVRYAIESLE